MPVKRQYGGACFSLTCSGITIFAKLSNSQYSKRLMLSKNQIAFLRSLQRKKVRQQEQLFVVEGPKLVEELLNSSFKPQALYALPNWLAEHTDLPADCEIHEIAAKDLERISQLNTPNQVVAVVHQKASKPTRFPKAGEWVLALDGVNDPGNLGTILRTADWFGITQIVASVPAVEAWNPKVVQSSMGSVFRVQVHALDLVDYLKTCAEKTQLPIWGADLVGEKPSALPSEKGGVLVLGSESHGISDEVSRRLTNTVCIPGSGHAESLNVAIAGAMLLYELHR